MARKDCFEDALNRIPELAQKLNVDERQVWFRILYLKEKKQPFVPFLAEAVLAICPLGDRPWG